MQGLEVKPFKLQYIKKKAFLFLMLALDVLTCVAATRWIKTSGDRLSLWQKYWNLLEAQQRLQRHALAKISQIANHCFPQQRVLSFLCQVFHTILLLSYMWTFLYKNTFLVVTLETDAVLVFEPYLSTLICVSLFLPQKSVLFSHVTETMRRMCLRPTAAFSTASLTSEPWVACTCFPYAQSNKNHIC